MGKRKKRDRNCGRHFPRTLWKDQIEHLAGDISYIHVLFSAFVTRVSNKHRSGWRLRHRDTKPLAWHCGDLTGIMNCQLPPHDWKLISKNTKAQWRSAEQFPDRGTFNKFGIIQGEWWECCPWWEAQQETRTSEHFAELFPLPVRTPGDWQNYCLHRQRSPHGIPGEIVLEGCKKLIMGHFKVIVAMCETL